MTQAEYLNNSDLVSRVKKIRLLVLDVDGVLSDGKIYFTSTGEEIKSFHTLDGQGLKILQQTGLKVAIITGRCSKIVENRAKDLGIELLRQGREDKFTALKEILAQLPYELEHIAIMGDDLPDLRIMTKVGLGLTVPNAHPEVTKRAHWQSTKQGGLGAVREACDLIMHIQGTYEKALEGFLSE